MGTVGSTASGERSHGKFGGGIFGSFGSAASVGSNFSKSASASAASASSVSSPQYKDLDSRLAALEATGAQFFQVEIYKQPLSSGVGDHHGLIYHYDRRFAPMAFGGSAYTVSGGICCLQIDWGQDGLSFVDVYFEHRGEIVKCKQCGITPATLLEQVREVKEREYHLLHWNCQHFSRHLFGCAGGNWHLNTQLAELEQADVEITAVCIYEEENPVPMIEAILGLVYWYVDHDALAAAGRRGERLQPHGLLLQWVPGGLGFRKIVDPIDVGVASEGHPLDARDCGLKPHVPASLKPGGQDGIVNTQYVAASPGAIKKTRLCSMRPAFVLKHLREVEGKSYQEDDWNCVQFVDYMMHRVLVRGGLAQLHDHLRDLAQRRVVFNGLQESFDSESTNDNIFTLVYRYTLWDIDNADVKPDATYTVTNRGTPARIVFLHLTFGGEGIQFQELLNVKFQETNTVRTKIPIKRARKTNIKVQLAAEDLDQQIREIEPRQFNTETWSSLHFCKHLFGLMPGTEAVRMEQAV